MLDTCFKNDNAVLRILKAARVPQASKNKTPTLSNLAEFEYLHAED